MRILYFAWLRTRVGAAEEEVTPPAAVRDVRGLLDWLKTRSTGHAEAFKDLSVVRVAVNQTYAQPDHRVNAGDEIAIFPPVTGGSL
jgi:sulfur-carrier protein